MEQSGGFGIVKTAAPLRLQVFEGLRQAIISGRLKPGQRLIERELTDMMMVSRTVIREVLRQLEAEGLVAMVPNRGPVVRELTREEATDLYRVRAVLEGFAARLFAENATDAEVQALAQRLDEVEAAYLRGEVDDILRTKNGFYAALAEGARSETLGQMIATLHARIWRWRALGLGHPDRAADRSKTCVCNLRAVVTAIAARDGSEAEARMRRETQEAAAEAIRLVGR